MEILFWWACGMSGALVIWFTDKYTAEKHTTRCPSRGAALAILISGTLGPFLLAVATITFIIMWLTERPKNPDSWWKKPIC